MDRPQQRTDSDGNYEIKAITAGYQYWVQVSADGYHKVSSLPIQIDSMSTDMRFDAGIITLPEGTFYVTGIVVDDNDKPVANASVSIDGEGQKHQQKRTDAQGEFTFEKLVAGWIHINAKTDRPTPLNGSVNTYAGASDVKIVVTEQGTLNAPQKVNTTPEDRPESIGPNQVVVKLMDPNAQPVAGARVGTYVDFSDVAENPPIWFFRDGRTYRAVDIASDAHGKVTLEAEDLFRSEWVTERKAPLIAIDAGHYFAGVREMSREDLGTEITLTLQPGCRVCGRVSAATARQRKWSAKTLTVYADWRDVRLCQSTSMQGPFEMVLPPGEYQLKIYAEDPDNAVELPIRIKPGQRDLDLTKSLSSRRLVQIDCLVVEVSPPLKRDKEIENMLGDTPNFQDSKTKLFMSSADLLLQQGIETEKTADGNHPSS